MEIEKIMTEIKQVIENHNMNQKYICHNTKNIYYELCNKYNIDFELIKMIIYNLCNKNVSMICYREYEQLLKVA
jgi:predicted XRE-type DNA-binding protein